MHATLHGNASRTFYLRSHAYFHCCVHHFQLFILNCFHDFITIICNTCHDQLKRSSTWYGMWVADYFSNPNSYYWNLLKTTASSFTDFWQYHLHSVLSLPIHVLCNLHFLHYFITSFFIFSSTWKGFFPHFQPFVDHCRRFLVMKIFTADIVAVVCGGGIASQSLTVCQKIPWDASSSLHGDGFRSV